MDIEGILGIMCGMVFILSFPVTIIYMRTLAMRERREAREIYHRIVEDRLAVIQTAIEAGFEDREIARLDRRLQGLIGQQEMLKLASQNVKNVPLATEDRGEMDTLEDEVENIIERRRRKQERELKRQIDQAEY